VTDQKVSPTPEECAETILYLKHLPVPHLHGEEDHHEGGKPDTASAEPKNAGAFVVQVLLTCEMIRSAL